ncbi:unnamed protein product [Cyprideis torosa]|uniref:Uncharacterized protein n=1 Tax=Cyprideis torosa TaxID=163714 RepID=A0A7R8W5J6_9CRUS|nr:unnamed protein product [Cyprideis torosa]CAG0885382.1 unnamed protein product [Cyprideis torosa]
MATQRMSGQFDGACIVEQFSSDLLACGRIIDSAVGSVLLRVHQKPFHEVRFELDKVDDRISCVVFSQKMKSAIRGSEGSAEELSGV